MLNVFFKELPHFIIPLGKKKNLASFERVELCENVHLRISTRNINQTVLFCNNNLIDN